MATTLTRLLFALFGVFVFGERLRRLQLWAIALAAAGVTILAASGGAFPTIALFLGITFTLYGVTRKQTPVGAMPGLFIETILLVPFVGIYLLMILVAGEAVFVREGLAISLLLVLAGPLTVIPLLFFAIAAKRLPLTTVG